MPSLPVNPWSKAFASGGTVRPEGILTRYQAQLPQRQAEASHKASVMGKSGGERWQPEYEVEPSLEAPMFSPDDLIGSGIPTKLAMLAKSMSPLAAMAGVIKNKGGNWLDGSVEGALKELKKTDFGLGTGVLPGTPDAAINQWIDKPLANYVRNQMATPEDPIRALAESWPEKQSALRQVADAKIAKIQADRAKAQAQRGVPEEYLTRSRQQELAALKERELIDLQQGLHFDSSAGWIPDADLSREVAAGKRMGIAPMAKDWEDLTDYHPHFQRAGETSTSTRLANPYLERIDPDAPVFDIDQSDFASSLGFNHLIDELSNAINPESGLPKYLQFEASNLGKVSVPQAVERVSAINAWRAAMKAEADQARANNAATVLHKEYPEQGMKWVELKQPSLPEGVTVQRDPKSGMWNLHDAEGNKIPGTAGQSEAEAADSHGYPQLQDALKYEGDTMGHCVGGYCDDVASGRSRIYSLRDAKGQPHVTIEVAPKAEPHEWINALTEDEYTKLVDILPGSQDPYNANPQQVLSVIKQLRPDLPEPPGSIVQIKGKQNRAPNPEYLPMVQDFVKSGKWSDVGDLQNTGLTRVMDFQHGGADPEVLKTLGEYSTMDDILSALEKAKGPQNFAQGGSVRPNKILTTTDLRAIIAAIQSGN